MAPDPAAALRWLQTLYEHADIGQLVLFSLPDRASATFSVDDGGIASAAEWAMARADRRNVYYSPCLMGEDLAPGSRGTAADVVAVPCLWLDVDLQGDGHAETRLPATLADVQAILTHLPPPTASVHSGGGLHLYWQFDEIWELYDAREREQAHRLLDDLQSVAITTAAHHGWHVDRTSDLARVLRVPGTCNRKGESPRPVVIRRMASERWDISLLSDRISDALEAVRGLRPAVEASGRVADTGGRNDRLKAIVAARLDRRESLEETIREVIAYDRATHAVPLFGDASEWRGCTDPQTNALAFVASVTRSINHRRLSHGAPPDSWTLGAVESLDADPYSAEPVTTWSGSDLLADDTPRPPALVEPGICHPGGFVVVAGPPKSMKSLWLQHATSLWSVGEPCTGMRPTRPLRVAFLQWEIDYHELRDRMRGVPLPPGSSLDGWRATARTRDEGMSWRLDPRGLDRAVSTVRQWFGDDPPDLIVVDPLANVYDGESESDNAAMLAFIHGRLEVLRQRVNPDACMVLVHHARKISRQEMADDPFNALRGAGSLRGHYSTGILLHRVSQESDERRMHVETRSGRGMPSQVLVYEDDSGFSVVGAEATRVAGETQAEQWSAEKVRQARSIVAILLREAQDGSLYTERGFADRFGQEEHRLPSSSTVRRLLREMRAKRILMQTHGHNVDPAIPAGVVHLCCAGMVYHPIDRATGEVHDAVPVAPELAWDPASDAMLPVADLGPVEYTDPRTAFIA
jgi:hypothetical protein